MTQQNRVTHLGFSINGGIPIAGWFMKFIINGQSFYKLMILGSPYFRKPPFDKVTFSKCDSTYSALKMECEEYQPASFAQCRVKVRG